MGAVLAELPSKSPFGSMTSTVRAREKVQDPLLHTTHYTLHTTHYTLHITHNTLHTTHYTLHTTHYTLDTTHYTLHTTHYTLHTTHYTPHTTHYKLRTIHHTLLATYSALHTGHSALHYPTLRCCKERQFFVDNLMVPIHFIIEMIWWTSLAPWEFEFSFLGSLHLPLHVYIRKVGENSYQLFDT